MPMSTAVLCAESAWASLWEGKVGLRWGLPSMERRRADGTGMGKSTNGKYSGRHSSKARIMGITGMPWTIAQLLCTVFRTPGMSSSTSTTHTGTLMHNNSNNNFGCVSMIARIVVAVDVTLRQM